MSLDRRSSQRFENSLAQLAREYSGTRVIAEAVPVPVKPQTTAYIGGNVIVASSAPPAPSMRKPRSTLARYLAMRVSEKEPELAVCGG